MDSAQDNLQNADGSKKESSVEENKELNQSPVQETKDEALNEESILQAHDSTGIDVQVSSDEEITSSEPAYTEKKDEAKAESEAEATTSSIDEDAMVEESDKEETAVVVSDEDLEKEDDTEEIHSDEDEPDEHEHHELELPDFAEFTPEAMLVEAEKLIKNEPAHKLKAHFEDIRKNLLKQLNEERQKKLAEFVEGGGVEMDFEYIQPIREKFRTIYSEYKSKRQKHYKELQDVLDNNYKVKQELIDKIKELVTKDESIGDTFKEFNAIQQEWRNIGPVPRQESGDLWRNYHHHVENFYEYIKINKELRDLDFKKNHEAKEALIAKAEGLLEIESIRDAFKGLQDLHKKWKNVGPVEREHREPMWERFGAVTKKLHEKREAHYEGMKERAGELIEEKKKLVAKLKEMDFSQVSSHNKWQQAIKEIETIRTDFRKLGRISHPENDTIWDEFRGMLRDFNHQKNQYYKSLKKDQQDNLAKKRDLVNIADSLKDSDDWRDATNELKRIQAQWKTIGHVPRSESDKIWKEFRGACNHFFDRLTSHNKDQDSKLDGNFTAKKELLEKLQAYAPPKEDQKKGVVELKAIINDWKKIGQVPRSKGKIESDFNKVLDEKFNAIDLDRKESQRIRFENKMDSLSGGGNNDRQLTNERQSIRKQIDEVTKELHQLETNMSFFSSSSPNNPLLKAAEKSIANHKEQIELLKEKMKMINVKIRAINKPEETLEAENVEGESNGE